MTDDVSRLMAENSKLLETVTKEIARMQGVVLEFEDKARMLVLAKDVAYAERNQCVAMIAKMAVHLHWPVWFGMHHPLDDSLWDADWRHVVLIQLPTGQISWHIHDSEVPRFDFITRHSGDPWDGHTTDEKYARMRAWRPLPLPGMPPP